MTHRRDLEQQLSDLYASESDLQAPDRVLSSALATIEDTPQTGGMAWRLPRLVTLGEYARFAIASLLVAAVTVIVLGVFNATQDVGQRTTPSPVAPSAKPRANEQTSGNFAVPFSYVLPEGVEFDYGTRNQTYFEIRIPAAAEAGHPAGVIVQAIAGGRIDPCDPESAYFRIGRGPQAVFDYLKTVPDLTVTDESPASVGDLPAFQAHVTAATETPTCEVIRPWVESTEAFTDIPRFLVVRMIAVDVQGEHVAFTVFGESSNPGWPEMSEELIDSFTFGTPDVVELDLIRSRLPGPEEWSSPPS